MKNNNNNNNNNNVGDGTSVSRTSLTQLGQTGGITSVTQVPPNKVALLTSLNLQEKFQNQVALIISKMITQITAAKDFSSIFDIVNHDVRKSIVESIDVAIGDYPEHLTEALELSDFLFYVAINPDIAKNEESKPIQEMLREIDILQQIKHYQDKVTSFEKQNNTISEGINFVINNKSQTPIMTLYYSYLPKADEFAFITKIISEELKKLLNAIKDKFVKLLKEYTQEYHDGFNTHTQLPNTLSLKKQINAQLDQNYPVLLHAIMFTKVQGIEQFYGMFIDEVKKFFPQENYTVFSGDNGVIYVINKPHTNFQKSREDFEDLKGYLSQHNVPISTTSESISKPTHKLPINDSVIFQMNVRMVLENN